jgi:hypothetical protein
MDKKVKLADYGSVKIYLSYEDMEVIAVGLFNEKLATKVIPYPGTLLSVKEAVETLTEELGL